MKKGRGIIVTENGIYEKIDNNGRIVIPHAINNEVRNENETTVDELGRVQIAKSIRKKMKIEDKDKLEIYISGKNIILKKINFIKNESRETRMIIDNKYEVILKINNLDFNSTENHQISTMDEFGRVLIWGKIRKEMGILEKDKLKVCIKDDIIILIKKEYDYYKRKKRNFNHNRQK